MLIGLENFLDSPVSFEVGVYGGGGGIGQTGSMLGTNPLTALTTDNKLVSCENYYSQNSRVI